MKKLSTLLIIPIVMISTAVAQNINYITYNSSTISNINVSGSSISYSNESYCTPKPVSACCNTYGHIRPMSDRDFQYAKQSIESKGFDSSRLSLAKQIISSNRLLCSQIRDLMELMSFEQTKLDLAKFSWHHHFDEGNYYQLNDAFSFESSIHELEKYTMSH